MTNTEEFNFLKVYLTDDVYKKIYETEDPIKSMMLLKKNWKSYLILISIFIAILGFILGYIGYYKKSLGVSEVPDPSNIIFQVIKLYIFQNDVLPPNPVELEIAKFLCPFSLIYSVLQVIIPLFQENLNLFRLEFFKNHTIVCGLNKWTIQLLTDLRREEKHIVVIEKNADNELNSKAQELGVILLNGNFADYYMLNRANVCKAKYLIVFTEDDTKNMEIAINTKKFIERRKKMGRRKIRCFIHIRDRFLCDSFCNHDIFEGTYKNIEMNLFNIYENDARVLFLSYPFDAKIDPNVEGERVHLLIIGFSHLGESVALQAAKMGHYANDKGIILTILDKNAQELEKNFLSRYPGLHEIKSLGKDYFDITFKNSNLENFEELERNIKDINEYQRVTAIIVCLEDKTSGIKIGIHLKSSLSSIPIKLYFPIQVYLDENEEIFNLPGLKQDSQILTPFGLIRSTCSKEIVLNEKLDEVAMAINEIYNEIQEDKTKTSNWAELPADFKDSSRYQADHLPIKLRALNVKVVKTKGKKRNDFRGLTEAEIDLLANMEHNRWCAERWLAGWTCGKRDNEKKENPLLKPFSKCNEAELKIKEIDREFIRKIDETLKILNLEIDKSN